MKGRTWRIDTSIGGLGDVWMRLNALHALAALRPAAQIVVRVAPPLQAVAPAVFGGRLSFDTAPNPKALTFTHLGLRGLAKDMMRGRRFVNPFHRSNAPVQRSAFIETLNRAAFSGLSAAGRIFLNDQKAAEAYGGWMQISDVPPARGIAWDTARQQLCHDFPKLRARLRQFVPAANDRNGPVIFPSGTGFQIMPASLARDVLPDARYAFHVTDRYQESFRAAGLTVVLFSNVNNLLTIASTATHALCTDSFPSHILQTYSQTTVIALSHFPRNRMVHPAFDGIVLDSTAPCCPCLTRARTGSNTCPVGREFCLVWDDAGYVKQLRSVISTP